MQSKYSLFLNQILPHTSFQYCKYLCRFYLCQILYNPDNVGISISYNAYINSLSQLMKVIFLDANFFLNTFLLQISFLIWYQSRKLLSSFFLSYSSYIHNYFFFYFFSKVHQIFLFFLQQYTLTQLIFIFHHHGKKFYTSNYLLFFYSHIS